VEVGGNSSCLFQQKMLASAVDVIFGIICGAALLVSSALLVVQTLEGDNVSTSHYQQVHFYLLHLKT